MVPSFFDFQIQAQSVQPANDVLFHHSPVCNSKYDKAKVELSFFRAVKGRAGTGVIFKNVVFFLLQERKIAVNAMLTKSFYKSLFIWNDRGRRYQNECIISTLGG